jgi:hypothetical protein
MNRVQWLGILSIEGSAAALQGSPATQPALFTVQPKWGYKCHITYDFAWVVWLEVTARQTSTKGTVLCYAGQTVENKPHPAVTRNLTMNLFSCACLHARTVAVDRFDFSINSFIAYIFKPCDHPGRTDLNQSHPRSGAGLVGEQSTWAAV